MVHFICVFLLLVDDTHIINLTLDVFIDFLQLQEEFGTLGLSM
jgi:hypothetical protein